MRTARNFIQETIDLLSDASKEVEKHWKLFQEGKIDKDEFEEEYKRVVGDWLDEMPAEVQHPNNGCKYSETCPTSEYFKSQDI